uniref:Uncharacterized protein n=1 Tax=Physcomitrium patens TaxID=3218 RepID=A0A2K1KSX0_PHYPA|nr:hypothetical protein PHYPA_003869 [Physcomitrium patens]
MFHRRHNHTEDYVNVPAGGGVGGTANYPAGQKLGYGYEAGADVNVPEQGYAYDTRGNAQPQYNANHGSGYVQHPQGPVIYGPSGTHPKKSNRAANWCAAAFIACWVCTWPCHGPCCCGL